MWFRNRFYKETLKTMLVKYKLKMNYCKNQRHLPLKTMLVKYKY